MHNNGLKAKTKKDIFQQSRGVGGQFNFGKLGLERKTFFSKPYYRGDCQQSCLRLCCPPGQLWSSGSVRVPRHRCDPPSQSPQFLPECVQPVQLVSATATALSKWRNIKEENLLSEGTFSCPHASDILLPAANILGEFELELEEGGRHHITNLTGQVILQTESLCLALERDKHGSTSPGNF